MQTKWLGRAQRIQAIAQAGLAFSKDVYDRERYEELMKLSVEMMADYSQTEIEVITDLWKGEKGYPTPKADVRGAVFRENQILLVREKHDELWSLPGGFCEIGLSPAENVIKEIKEESGYDTEPSRLLAVLDSHKHLIRLSLIIIIKSSLNAVLQAGRGKQELRRTMPLFSRKTGSRRFLQNETHLHSSACCLILCAIQKRPQYLTKQRKSPEGSFLL